MRSLSQPVTTDDQRFSRVSAVSQAGGFATACHRLRPRGSIKMTCGGTSPAPRVMHAVSLMSTELEEVPMRLVVALDVHRRQITYKSLDRESGEVRRGRIVPATRGGAGVA